MDWEKIEKLALNLTVEYGLKIIYAILILLIGLKIINLIVKLLKKIFIKKNIDESLRPFLLNLINWVLKILVFISVLSTLGVEMTSFVAILGAMGLAIGMALSGTLQNFAGGIIILILRPFKVGDYIEAQNNSGSVKEIQVFNTLLTTPDNKTIVLANGALSTNTIVNYSTQDKRRVEWIIGISYGDDFIKVKELIKDILNNDNRILKEPEYFIAINALSDSSVDIVVRAWVLPSNYWDVHFDFNEKIYTILPKNNINFPFPQMDLHIKNKQI